MLRLVGRPIGRRFLLGRATARTIATPLPFHDRVDRQMATTNLPVKPGNDSSLGEISRLPQAGTPRSSDALALRAEYVVTGLDELANWARKGSMWPMTFGLV